MVKILLIIQARMGSTRLPGKVLREVAGKPILGHVLDRLKPSQHVSQVIVATTHLPEDDAIEAFCHQREVACYRGSDWNVLDRFAQAVKQTERPDAVVRICCDNPLHHYRTLDEVIEEFIRSGVDYCSNSNHEPEFLEDGFDVEVFTTEALETAHREARMMSECEHVTPYIKKCGKFRCTWLHTQPGYQYKLSVDTPDDLKLAEAIFSHFGPDQDFGMKEVIELLQRKPELLDINKESKVNEGYARSLKEDREIDH